MKWDWSHAHGEGFHKNLSSKSKFKKTETRFCRWKSNECNNINIFMSRKPLYLFACKRKDLKTHFNTNYELSPNLTEKQFMSSKATLNWVFNDMRCYLVICCFDWKIDLFQQAVVRFIIFLNGKTPLCKQISHMLSFSYQPFRYNSKTQIASCYHWRNPIYNGKQSTIWSGNGNLSSGNNL